MEGIKGDGGGGGRVGFGEDIGDEMLCSDHPHRNNPGGICAFCLQEKLGKLVSSSFPSPVRGSSSSSSSPSFRSDIGSSFSPTGTIRYQEAKRNRIQFLLAKKKKKVPNSSQSDRDIVFKRSKSTTTPTTRNPNYLDADDKRTGFWSFLYKSNIATKKTEKSTSFTTTTPIGSALKPKERCLEEEDEEFSPNSQATASASASSFGRRVSRSRSVGCVSSRSFSGGDLFERISTGFGDCTLRRVESQREAKPKVSPGLMNERVKCGGLFSRFVMTSSSLSYWVSSSSSSSSSAHVNVSGRSRSWVWAFTIPMGAFTAN